MVNAFQLEKAGDDLDPDVLTSVLFFGLMIHVHPTLSVCRNQESRLNHTAATMRNPVKIFAASRPSSKTDRSSRLWLFRGSFQTDFVCLLP